MSDFELVSLKSGLKTLRSRIHGQTFHPVTGPVIEATILHVDQQRLLERSRETEPFIVWDVGFGAAANALVAISALRGSSSQIEIHSFDKSMAPFEFAISHSAELDYLLPYESSLSELVRAKQTQIGPKIRWQLHLGDFRDQIRERRLPSPHAILYDPYSPAENPEMWSLEHFTHLRQSLNDGAPCLWSNYTRSTSVRVTLLLAGFYVGAGAAVGEKSETTVAANCLELLERPLDRSWLSRVQASTNAAPLRSTGYTMSKISDEDFLALQNCPQFLHFQSQK